MNTVLIVDDEHKILNFLQSTLENLGLQIFLASSHDEAEKLYKNVRLDFLITDIILDPESKDGKSGVNLIKGLRELNPGVKIIAISGGGILGDAKGLLNNAESSGADIILEKPFEAQDVLRAMVKLLAE